MSILALFRFLWLQLDFELRGFGNRLHQKIFFRRLGRRLPLFRFPLVTIEKEKYILEHNDLVMLLLSLTFSFCTEVSRVENVVQQASTLSVQEGNSCVVCCSYSDSTLSHFSWYSKNVEKVPSSLQTFFQMWTKKMKDSLFYSISWSNISPSTSQPLNLETQLSTSVQWAHIASQAPAVCTQTCDRGSPLFVDIDLQLEHLSFHLCASGN